MARMELNVGRKAIAWISIDVFLLAGIYPPWTRAARSYDWLFARAGGLARVDFTRLLIEWIAIAVVAAGFWFLPLRPRSRSVQQEVYTGSMSADALAVVLGVPLDPSQKGMRVDFELKPPPKPAPGPEEKYPYAVKLKDGEYARVSTKEGARYFKRTNPSMLG